MEEEKLVEYILGLLSEEECREIEKWYLSSDENAKKLDQLYFVMQMKRTADIMDAADPDKAFLKFKDQVRQKRKKESIKKNLHLFQRIAAVLFVPLLLISGYMALDREEERNRQIKVTTNAGMVSQFSLPDGSKVWLNSGSTLEYPDQFNRSKRKVQLTGQGYFDIVKQDRQPFIVEVSDTYAIRVHGTELNMVAYDDENTIETTLITGSIEIMIGEVHQFIKPEQKAIFNKETKQLFIQQMNPVLESSWKDGWIIFRSHPMEEVLKILGRYYNVKFVVEEEDVMNSFITGRFEHEQLPQVMEYLHLASGIKYRIQKPVIRDNEIVEKSVVYISK